MIIIGISGKKKSGKTLMAQHIADVFPKRCKIISFADALKDDVCEFCKVSRQFLEDNKEDFRLILQGYGTNFRRKHSGNDYWIQRFLTTCYAQPTNTIIVVPDVRFKNEAKTILQINGLLFRIERLDCDIQDQHPSEIELDQWTAWDMVLRNDSSIENFKNTINSVIKDWNIH